MKSRAEAADVCTSVLQGDLTLEEFHERWPREDEGIFLRAVFGDLEDAVEHTPGHLFSGRINEEVWKRSWERRRVLIDMSLLQHPKAVGDEQLVSVRSELLQRPLTDTDEEVTALANRLLDARSKS